MKYLILVPDGCADRPSALLGGKTPLENASMTEINRLAAVSRIGLVKTIPDGLEPGSEAGNLSILGYDPAVYLTGRAPLEAAAMGIPMRDDDTAFRASLVTLETPPPCGAPLQSAELYESLLMRDHSAGEIENGDAEVFLRFIDRELGCDGLRFFPGVSYRGLMITDRISGEGKIMEPHNILGRTIGEYLPEGRVRELMERSYELLKTHPLNLKRTENGLRPANSLWIWGQGKKLTLPPLTETYHIKGSMIAAVNLLKGIGRCAGLECPDIPGATGTLHTNYKGKAGAAINAFENGSDFVYIHVEAPDECAHTGDAAGKVQSLERIDREIMTPVAAYLKNTGEAYRILILPDHKTLLDTQTHNREPVPFVLFDSEYPLPADKTRAFSEACGARGETFDSGEALMECLMQGIL